MSRFPDVLLTLPLVALLAASPLAAQPAAPGVAGADAVASGAADDAAAAATTDTARTQSPAAENPAAESAPGDASGVSVWPGAGKAFQLGRAALPEELAAWDTDVRPDGLGLPEGQGDVATGEELFSEYCAACHGEFAEGVDNWPKLAGGMNTLNHDDPLKTVGSYWPYLSTAWDYVHRSMPFGSAQTLDADQTYALVAYILYSNDLVDDDFVLSKDSFATVAMPNALGFIEDDRETSELPLFSKPACMDNCKNNVAVTKRAAILDVTPGGPEDGGTDGGAGDDPAAPKIE